MITVILFIIVIIVCLSPITKYLIEKYDKDYTGREIYIDRVYVNPFTGYVNFKNLRIHELNNDSVFFSANHFSIDLSLLKLFKKQYVISEVTLTNPRGIIIQNNKSFNFTDLITKFSKKDTKKKQKEPVKFWIKKIKIIDGIFYYKELVTPIYYYIKKANFECSEIRWDSDTIPIHFSFLSGTGVGNMKGNFTLNVKNNDYALNVLVTKFDMNIVGQYIKDLSNYGYFSAFLDAYFHSKGNLIERENVTATGKLKISEFHFGKSNLEDYASFDKLELSIHEVSPKKMIYFYDSVTLHKPYFKYEKYDDLDNVQTIFGKKGAKVKAANVEGAKFNLVIEIAKYIKVISKNFLRSNYRVDRLAVYDANLTYHDYSLNEKFAIALKPFNFSADSIDKKHQRVNFKVQSNLQPYGQIHVAISINPKDSSDFDLNFKFNKIPVSIFNPYLTKLTSFPLDRGTLEINGVWNVRNGVINSTNHLVIIDPRIGERIKNKNSKRLPMRIIMFIARERGNVIDYEIPIKGDLKNPKFILKDAIFDALGNIFIKPPTTPYRLEVRNIETEIEKSLSLKWEIRNSNITKSQAKFLQSLAEFADDNPKAIITISPQNYDVKEKESILLFEAKKKYYKQNKIKKSSAFDEDDSLNVENMSIKDSLFVQYLNNNCKYTLLFNIQSKCAVLIDESIIQNKLNKLYQNRLAVFKSYFESKESLKRLSIKPGANIMPYNGYSFYKIAYQGEFPERLIKAYRRMNLLNKESPRDKYIRKVNQK